VILGLPCMARAQLGASDAEKLYLRSRDDEMERRRLQQEAADSEKNLKEMQDILRQTREQEKEMQDVINRETQEVRPPGTGERQAGLAGGQGNAAGSNFGSIVFPQKLTDWILFFGGIFLIYFIIDFLLREGKKPALTKDLLEAVDSWRLFGGSPKKYMDSLSFLISPAELDIKSDDFRNNFTRDMIITEALSGVSPRAEKNDAMQPGLPENDHLLEPRNITAVDRSFYIREYKFSLSQKDRFYPTYYKAFFFLIFLANKGEEAEISKFREKYLSIKALVEDKEGRIILSEEKMKKYIDDFVSREKFF